MANTYTFDGPNQLIQLNETGSFTVLDLYSRWKDWLLISDNTKYYQAFRYVGGDPTVGSDSLGITYFLTNGWRIAPQLEDHRLQVDGNLFTNEGDSPFFYDPGSGIVSVQIENKVSNLTDSTILDNPIALGLDYRGAVYVDPLNGSSGVLHPIGTSVNPVNNLSNAKQIATTYGIHKFLLANDLNISSSQNIDGYTWEGLVANVKLNFEIGSSANNTSFNKLRLTGTLSDDFIYTHDCSIYDFNGFGGVVSNSGLSSSLHTGTLPVTFDKCYSNVPGSETPIIDFSNHTHDQFVNIRAYSGGIKFINNNNSNLIATVEFVAGKFEIDSTMTAGFVSVRGVGNITGIEAGTTYETGSLIWNKTSDIEEHNTAISASLENIQSDITEISSSISTLQDGSDISDDQIREIWEMHGLDISKPLTVSQSKRLFGSVDQNISTIGTGSAQVTIITRN